MPSSRENRSGRSDATQGRDRTGSRGLQGSRDNDSGMGASSGREESPRISGRNRGRGSKSRNRDVASEGPISGVTGEE